jgi:mannose-1-phosphate guanylyltransferase
MDLKGELVEPRDGMVTRAAVLCGGEGTRLRPLTNYFQKTMIPVGAKKRPLLEYIVRLLSYNGIKDITLLTGYRTEDIEGYFEDGAKFGVRLNYSRDVEKEKGSARSLQNALKTGKIGRFDDLVIYYGDVLSALKVRDLLANHEKEKAAMSLVLSRDYKVPVGVAQVKDGSVVSFREKPVLPLSATMGSLVISKGCLGALSEVTSKRGSVDIMTHFVPAVIGGGLKVAPFYIEGFWYDVGTTEAYEKLDTKLVDSSLSFLE